MATTFPVPPAPAAAPPAPPVQVDRTDVHSVDKGPKTGSKGSHIVVVFFIAIVCIIAIILLVVGFQLKDATQTCSETENLNCYTLTCPVGSTPIETCSGTANSAAVGAPTGGEQYSYRCTSTTTLQCGWDPGTDLTILAADGDICANYSSTGSS